ncbi:hypothetical protein [uncultured Flavobacterium sp.]|uniref:hypothetical protein n=1 Tax=uncultured Flavobacterium sp. TaxID=165435 RepID=UPI0025EC2431|nr:hypothetical protein [uncultured Flavobacterium sp.]
MINIYMLFIMIFNVAQGHEKAITLSIKNSYVNYVNKNGTSIYNYKSDIERDNSSNIVTVELTNESNRKYLLMIDKSFIFPESSLNSDMRSLNFLISNNDRSYISIYNPITSFEKGLSGIYELKIYNDSLIRNKYKKMDIPNRNFHQVFDYEKNSIVIYPGETKTFKYVVNLPIIREMSWKRDQGVIAYKNLKEGQKFKIAYSCKASKLKRILPDYILKELKENDIEIFDGIIESNEIPLKLGSHKN